MYGDEDISPLDEKMSAELSQDIHYESKDFMLLTM